MIADRMTEDADWRDGMSQFRVRILEEIQLINEKLEQLEQQIKEKTP